MSNYFNSNRPEMQDPAYKTWRYAIYARDLFCCVLCKVKNQKIQAHHIKRWADYPELRYVISNGVTLCKSCHDMVTGREDQYAIEFKKYIEQVKLNKQLLSGSKKKKGNIFPNSKKLKYRLRNPHSRY